MSGLKLRHDRRKWEASVRLRARSRTLAWISLCRRAAVVVVLEAAEAPRAGAVGKVATSAHSPPDLGKCYGSPDHPFRSPSTATLEPPPHAEAKIDHRLLRLSGPTQTATTPARTKPLTAGMKTRRIRNLRFMGKATAPNPINGYSIGDSLRTTAEPPDHAPTCERKLLRRPHHGRLKSRSKSSEL